MGKLKDLLGAQQPVQTHKTLDLSLNVETPLGNTIHDYQRRFTGISSSPEPRWKIGEAVTTQIIFLPATNRKAYIDQRNAIVVEQEGNPVVAFHKDEWDTIVDFVTKVRTLDKL